MKHKKLVMRVKLTDLGRYEVQRRYLGFLWFSVTEELEIETLFSDGMSLYEYSEKSAQKNLVDYVDRYRRREVRIAEQKEQDYWNKVRAKEYKVKSKEYE
jgi:hypothetical protein